MVKIENHLGTIEISRNFFTNLVANAATSCFGVAGMSASDLAQGMLSRIGKDPSETKGVKVRARNGKLIVDLHIIVTYGVNISAIVDSIVHKVGYTVEEVTGIHVHAVNVFVDGMRTN